MDDSPRQAASPTWTFTKEAPFDEPKASAKPRWTMMPFDETEAEVITTESISKNHVEEEPPFLSPHTSTEEVQEVQSQVDRIKSVSFQGLPIQRLRKYRRARELETESLSISATGAALVSFLTQSIKTCNYDTATPSYQNLSTHLDNRVEQFDKKLFGSLSIDEVPTDCDTDDGGATPSSSCPTSPIHKIKSPIEGESVSSMYKDLQEELGVFREKSDAARSVSSTKYKSILKSKDFKSLNSRTALMDDASSHASSEDSVEDIFEVLQKQVPHHSEHEEGIEQVVGQDFKLGVQNQDGITQEQVFPKSVDISPEVVKLGVQNQHATTEKQVASKSVEITSSPDVGVETNVDEIDGGAPPVNVGSLKNMSSLTEDGKKQRSIGLLPSASSKSCRSGIGLGLLRRLKLTKTSSTGSTSKMTSESYPTMRMVSKSASAGSEVNQAKSMCYLYDYGSENNAYVAYFRREKQARRSIRLYEHPIPPVFSTLVAEVVVKIEASTVSPSDCAIRQGKWWGEGSRNALNLPIVPGVAFSGRIHQGSKSAQRSGFSVGDRVISLVRVGANSRHLCISTDRLVKVPPSIRDPASVCCLPEVYLAAFQALHLGQKNASRYRKTSLAGKSVLVLGGDTLFGHAAIELGVAGGATIVYGSCREKSVDTLKQIGGFPLHNDTKRWFNMVEGKIDIVVATERDYSQTNFEYEHVRTLTAKGKLVLITGPDSDEKSVIDLNSVGSNVSTATSKRELIHYNVFDSWERDLKLGKRDLVHLVKLVEEGQVKPEIIERIPLTKVAKAQDLMENRVLRAFVVCEPWVKGKKRGSVLNGTNFYSESLNHSLSSMSMAAERKMTAVTVEKEVAKARSKDVAIEAAETGKATKDPAADTEETQTAGTKVESREQAAVESQEKKPTSTPSRAPWVIGKTTESAPSTTTPPSVPTTAKT